MASKNGSEADDTQENEKNDNQKTEISSLKRPPPFTLKIPLNIVRSLMCTGH